MDRMVRRTEERLASLEAKVDSMDRYNHEQFVALRLSVDSISEKEAQEHTRIADRVKILEDWKLQFTAKLTAYVTIALLVGSFLANILLSIISKWWG